MPTYNRTQLRDGVNADADLTADTYNFSLVNNSGNNYFTIEGQNSELPFTKASINTLVNCSFVTGSKNAGFSVNGNSTATFNLVVTDTISANDIKFRATNSLIYNINDTTASGSVFGIEGSYSSAAPSYLYESDFSAGTDNWVPHPVFGGNVTLAAPETVGGEADSLKATTDGGDQNWIFNITDSGLLATTGNSYEVTFDIYVFQNGGTFDWIHGDIISNITISQLNTWESKTITFTATSDGYALLRVNGTPTGAGDFYALKNIKFRQT